MPRAFIAIQLSEELRRQIGRMQDQLRRELSGKVGWTNPQGIHVTLKFLGDIAEAQIQPLEEVLRQAAAATKPFTLKAEGLGVFPNTRAPRVLWLGLQGSEADLGVLRCLQAGIEDGAERLGFSKEDRAFSPHLTLARFRDRVGAGLLEKALESHRNRAVGGFTAATVELIQSELLPSGPRYTTLVEVPFGGGV